LFHFWHNFANVSLAYPIACFVYSELALTKLPKIGWQNYAKNRNIRRANLKLLFYHCFCFCEVQPDHPINGKISLVLNLVEKYNITQSF